MKRLYQALIYFLFLWCSCSTSSDERQVGKNVFCSSVNNCPKDRLKTALKNEFQFLYPMDTISIVIRCKLDTVFSEIKMPSSRTTDVEYNQLLLSHIFYTLYEEENSLITSWVININHNYDNSNTIKLYDAVSSKVILRDNSNVMYRKVTKLLLKNISDRDVAFYDLAMEEARKLFPRATIGSDIFSLFTTYPFRNNRKFYSEEEALKIEFELKLFYWITQFPYGSLEFDRKNLDSLIEILDIEKEEEWDKEYLQKLYDEI